MLLFKSDHLPFKICKRAGWKRKEIIHCLIQAEGWGWIAIVMKWCWSGKARELQLAEWLYSLPYCFPVFNSKNATKPNIVKINFISCCSETALSSQLWSRKMLNVNITREQNSPRISGEVHFWSVNAVHIPV